MGPGPGGNRRGHSASDPLTVGTVSVSEPTHHVARKVAGRSTPSATVAGPGCRPGSSRTQRDGSSAEDALHAYDHNPTSALPYRRRSPDPVCRQRRLAGTHRPAHEPLAGERVRVRADLVHACRARPPLRRRPAGVRRIRTPRQSPVSAGDGRVSGRAHRRGRSRQAPHRRARRRNLGHPVCGCGTSGADRRRDRRHRRNCGPDPARRTARVVGARPGPRQVPQDGRAGDRRRGGGHDRGRRPGRHPRGLPRLLRRGPLRRVDALCPPISAGAARACRAAAADRHAGHDHQRP